MQLLTDISIYPRVYPDQSRAELNGLLSGRQAARYGNGVPT